MLYPELMFSSKTSVFGPRKYVGRRRKLYDCFYSLVGRFRTLRVPARRLGALTRGASLDVRKVPQGDHFGRKTNV